MMNYLKSEFYRVTHMREFYITAAVFAGLVILLNLGIYKFGNQYATTSFSYSTAGVVPMIFAWAGAIIVNSIYGGIHKDGNLKNAVSGGVPRIKLFISQCITGVFTATTIMILTLAIRFLCAELLLASVGPFHFTNLLLEPLAVYPTAAALLISMLLFFNVFEKDIVTVLAVLTIWFFLPRLVLLLSLKHEFLQPIAMWMPENILRITVNMRQYSAVWETAQGFLRCILSGTAGIVIFTLLGSLYLRKKDL